MEPIRFNDTSDYRHMEVLGVEGVFTNLRIQRDTLPEGFYKYALRGGGEALCSQVGTDILVDHAGDFITRKPLDLGADGLRALEEEDWWFTEEPFDFEGYFGTKRSVDCQIADAEAKRDAQFAPQSHEISISTGHESR